MAVPTPHNTAKMGDFAKTVLMPGDPLRSQFIAENFLTDAHLVNNVRGVQGYTGSWKGTPVSVMASGMGIPSIGIYSWELFNFYGVDNIIRIGSAGAIQDDIHLRDIVFGLGACTTSHYVDAFGLPGLYAPTADFLLLQQLMPQHRQKASSRALEIFFPRTISIPTAPRPERKLGKKWACWPWKWNLPVSTPMPPARGSELCASAPFRIIFSAPRSSVRSSGRLRSQK